MHDSHMTSPTPAAAPTTQYLSRPEGRIAYDLQGEGPLVVLVPGMADLRSSFRHLTPRLLAAGYSVATTDLRGHGDSDTSFTSYGDVATAGDVHALIQELGGKAVIVGNSLGAGAGVIVDAEHPEAVDALVLIGPFVRNPPVNAITLAVYRVLMAPLWVAAVWKRYMPTLYAGRKPDDFADYRKAVIDSLKRPGYGKAFSLTTKQTDHDPAEVALPAVTAPTLVVMGELDPDFKDATAEAAWISDQISARVVMVADAGHYPQAQQPVQTADAVIGFLKEVHRA